ncbi:MAG TPA: serine hydrolase domain-containing protein [Allosphingosinicella sp.]|nr:serine hydrolase domain-containing protein [Allosphingosinicella sp.]
MMLALALAASTLPPEARFAALADPYRPGCAVGIIEDGRLVHARGYGSADLSTGRPITARTAFNIASMSKQFTAAAIGLLIADGKLGEEDDVRKYLPELPDYGPTIRIRHLLHHMSGLRNHMALASFQPDGPLPTHEEALGLVFRQKALNFRPGTRHQYDSPNYVLLAEIVERVSAMKFERFLKERIFLPLGMRDTGFASPRLARAYNAAPDGKFALNEAVNRARGSSGLLSTVEDLAKWLAALGDGRVIEKPLFQRMLAGTKLEDGTPVSYSYGLQVERDHEGVSGLTMIGHGGQTAAYRSTFSYFPEQRSGTMMLCNVSNAPLGLAREIAGAWVKSRFSPSPPASAGMAAVPLSPEEAARLAGIYHDPEGDELRTFAAEGSTLKFVYAGEAYPLTHLGGGRFALEGLGELRFEGEKMVETGPTLAFTRLAGPEPAPLDSYAGRYVSKEVDGEAVFLGEDGRLMMKLPGGEVPLGAIAPDTFAAPAQGFGRIAFLRDSSGAVAGLTLSTLSGISRLRFDRAS